MQVLAILIDVTNPEIVCRDRDKLQQLLQEEEYPTWLVKAHINIEDSDLLLERYPDSKVIAMTQDHPKVNKDLQIIYGKQF